MDNSVQKMVQGLQPMDEKWDQLCFLRWGVGTQTLMFTTVNKHCGGTLPLQSPKQTLINSFTNGPPLAETGK